MSDQYDVARQMIASPTTGYPTVWEAHTGHYIVPVRVSGQLMANLRPSKQGRSNTRFAGLQRRSDGSYELQLVEVEPDRVVAAALHGALGILESRSAQFYLPHEWRAETAREIRVALGALAPPTA